MSESLASASQMSEVDRNANVYNQLKGDDEINEDNDIDEALKTLRAEQKPLRTNE